jgi:hypothetical protein
MTDAPELPEILPVERSPMLWSLVTGTTPRAVTILGWTVYAGLMVLLAGQAFLPIVPQDEGELLAYPWLMTRGFVLYRDIWAMYPPATYLALAGLMKVGSLDLLLNVA